MGKRSKRWAGWRKKRERVRQGRWESQEVFRKREVCFNAQTACFPIAFEFKIWILCGAMPLERVFWNMGESRAFHFQKKGSEFYSLELSVWFT
jgi:hypothetical protein